jgi:hypothetical protein
LNTDRWRPPLFDYNNSDTDGSNAPELDGNGSLSWTGAKDSGSDYEKFRVISNWYLTDDQNLEYEIMLLVDFPTIQASGTGEWEFFKFGFAESNVQIAAAGYTAFKYDADTDEIIVYHKNRNGDTTGEKTLSPDDFPMWLKVKRVWNWPTWQYLNYAFYKDGVWMSAETSEGYAGTAYESPREIYPFMEFSTITAAGITDADLVVKCQQFLAPILTAEQGNQFNWDSHTDNFYGDNGDYPDQNLWDDIQGKSPATLNGYPAGFVNLWVNAGEKAIVRSKFQISGDFTQIRGKQQGGPASSDSGETWSFVGWEFTDTITGYKWRIGHENWKIADPKIGFWEWVGGDWQVVQTGTSQGGTHYVYLRRTGDLIEGRGDTTSTWYPSSLRSSNPLQIDIVYEQASNFNGTSGSMHEQIQFTADPEPLILETAINALNIRRSAVTGDDRGTAEIQGRAITKSVQLMMYGNKTNANWAADRATRRAAYPFAEGQLKVNRNAFKYEIGDLFKLSDSEHSITDMVCRAMNIGEGPLDSEEITIAFMEEPDYVTSSALLAAASTAGRRRDYTLDPLTHVDIVEAPYSLAGDDIALIPIAGREKGTEIGYEVWMSIDDGASYSFLEDVNFYATHGVLVGALGLDALTLDKYASNPNPADGFEVDLSFDEDATMETITRTELFSNGNMALVGDEILNFETVTPDAVVDARYALTNLNRGRFDSVRTAWPSGTDFWYVGSYALQVVRDVVFVKGATLKFKFVPYNEHFVGDIANATEIEYEIVGRAKAPYIVGNLKASGKSKHATYGRDIHLAWDPRVRGVDAGINAPDSAVDASPTHEGHFDIVVKDSVGATVRTVSALDVYAWSYTSAMNLSDNGSLESPLTFQVDNYIDAGGVKYTNIHSNTVEVTLISSTTTTTTVTQTTTTTTSTTTTSTTTTTTTTTTT